MGYWKWFGKGIKNIFISDGFIIMLPWIAGASITVYIQWDKIWLELWMFIPMIGGLIGTILLGAYNMYLFDKRLENL